MAIAPGARFGPYELVSRIGAGGMGEVWKARDTRLGREIALKVLPEHLSADADRLRRFEQEARSASALNHPNIVTIHDVGSSDHVAFLAMELVEGVSLRQLLALDRMTPPKAIDITSQIAEGLARAHSSGIVHRDLKPENVMVTPDGLVKILDFGLAKLSPPEVPPELATHAPTVTRQTEPGVVLGTVGYMSPEQASGRPADFRSDQFSLGAILYEMLAGRRAFGGATPIETLSAILREEPPPLSAIVTNVPEAVPRIVSRCLAKDPEKRYASTRDLARDLAEAKEGRSSSGWTPPLVTSRRRPVAIGSAALLFLLAAGIGFWALRGSRSSGRPAGGDRSIAILPFQNFGGRAEDEYFSDGMTESLITDLAKVKGLLVIARNSAFAYKNRNVDVRKVGEELQVRYVLEGSVQRASESVRVNAQLIDSRTGYHVWAEKYDRPMKDVFAVQDDLSARIVRSLKAAIAGSGTGPSSPPTSNLEAYDVFLRARYYLNQFDWARKDESIPLFEKAVALDPGFAWAHAGLASAYAKKAFEGDPQGLWRSKANAEIEKALAIDPTLAQAYAVRGQLAWNRDNGFPHEQAAADFHKAIELNPSYDSAHGQLASLYYHVGLLDKALGEYGIALKIAPHDLDDLYRIPRIHLYQQKYAEALAEFEGNPRFREDFQVPIALAHLGRWEEARRRAEQHAGNPTHPPEAEVSDQASTMAVLRAHAGDAAGAERDIATAVSKSRGSHFHHASYNVATAYALLGRKKEAVAWLEKTAELGMPCYPLFEKDPFLDKLRGDSAFEAFLTRQRAQWQRFEKTL